MNTKHLRSINKIILFVSSPFNARDYKRFGIDILRQNFFEVEVWDFAPFMNPTRARGKSNFDKHYVFFNKKDAISAISKLTNDCLIVAMIGYNYENYGIYRAISRNKLAYCMVRYHFPSSDFKSERSISKRLKSITLRNILMYVFRHIPPKFLGIRGAQIIVAMGGKIDLSGLPMDKRTSVLLSHVFDYDIYLEEIKKPFSVDKNLAVFMDNYLPFHPDVDTGQFISPEEYYPLLCRFFDSLERQCAVRIVIAAHPRSDYEAHPDYFAGRDIIKGRTAELVKKAKFVILHDSASVNFAVLFKKPVVSITTDRLSQSNELFIDIIASLLGKKPINLDRTSEVHLADELTINEDAYQNYKNIYIKQDGTKETPIWQAFADYLKSA